VQEEMRVEKKIERDIRLLKAYALAITILLGIFIFTGFRHASENRKFEEIDVERINVVEKNGVLKLVISNKEHFPDPVIDGKTAQRQGGASPGMIFYNDEGDECGGLIFAGREAEGTKSARAALLFDQYNQDQTVGIMYSEDGGRRSAGLQVWDRPDTPLLEFIEKLEAIREMNEGPEQKRAMEELQAAAKRGEYGAKRVFVGKNRDKEAVVMLSDNKGQPRLCLKVTASGEARLDFLDESGQVVLSFPGDFLEK
jgi:hypothetical protein